MSRPELLERYRELPLPSTRDEHWRFTDLAGFDPKFLEDVTLLEVTHGDVLSSV